MSNTQVTQYLGELFETTCTELFRSINSDVITLDNFDFDTSDIPHSQMDAGCNDIEVIIHLHVPFSTLAMTYPVHSGVAIVDEIAMEDWICELSNLLMGKLKHRLSTSAIDLSLGLPSYSIGGKSNALHSNGEYFIFSFELYQQTFAAGISIEVFNNDLLLSAPKPDMSAVPDGNIEFF